MDELEKIKYAKTFIDKLAQGINPIDDNPVAEYDVVNNVRLSRCFFYVSDILRQVIENGGLINNKQSKKLFYITQEQLGQYDYLDTPIPLSSIARQLNSLIDINIYKKISYNDLANWLIKAGILGVETDSLGRSRKFITEKGNKLGLILDIRRSGKKEYSVILYNQTAQKFIIDNLYKIIDLENEQ